jgi:hypothetical protein
MILSEVRTNGVKCDEGKPSCKRCERYGKECTGYSDQFSFRHTEIADFAASTRYTPQPKPREQPGSSSRSSLETDLSYEDKDGLSKELVPRSNGPNASTSPSALNIQVLRLSYDQVLLRYFIRRFVSPNGSDGFPGHLTFLPGLYDCHNQGILETATLSVASMAADEALEPTCIII